MPFTLSVISDDPQQIAAALREAAAGVEHGSLRINRSYAITVAGRSVGWYRQTSYRNRRRDAMSGLDQDLTTVAGVDQALTDIEKRDK